MFFYRIQQQLNFQKVFSMSFNRNHVVNLQSPNDMVAQSNLFQSSMPNLNINGEKDHSSKQSAKSIEEATEDIGSRKDQHVGLYFINLVVSFCISFQNIILVFTQDDQSKAYMSICIALCTVCFSLISTYLLCKDKWKIFNLYVLLDNIFLAQVASSFGFIGFLLVIYYGYWYQVITMVAFPLQIVFFVGNFRVMMLHVKWSKWRVILFKLVLLADSAVFFQIGAYYMSVDFQYTGGVNKQLDGKVKDFVLLYIFGLFALFVELYSKMCDIDQTSELKFDYELKEMEDQKKIEKIRRSVIGINRQVEKARTKYLNELKKKSYLQVQNI